METRDLFLEIQPSDLAVVGMACRFPDADGPTAFWANLSRGFESVRQFSEAELLEAGVDPALIAQPNYVRAGVVLDGLDQFDASFFGFSARDAAIMDPQHRIFLECVWEALEHSGHQPEVFPGSIGVFAGCGMNAYLMYNLLTNKALMDSTGMFLVRHTGNDKDFLATRASYQYNLRGPSISIQTACSTSLVAIHTAAQSLLSGECDLALAGGVTIEIPHRRGYEFHEGEILSRDGHCRPFDADSSGTIFGSGCGIVALRRLADAIDSGDTIYAIVKGSAVNNDGSAKVGYLAPSVDGQANAIQEALAIANVDPRSISYVEAHGTGTAVGDPIEIAALTQAFRHSTQDKQFCAIGSVKSNIGHLDTAAGVASFIKTVEALRHRQIPPTLHFRRPNPLIDFASSPFYVNDSLRDWTATGSPRRAAVNSLGVGGTNAHVILQEAPEIPPAPCALPLQLVPISARSAEALEGSTQRFELFFESLPPEKFADVAFTAQTGRTRFRHRRFVVASSPAAAAGTLSRRDTKQTATVVSDDSGLRPIFMFPGGGAQYPDMGRQLYEQLPVFRRSVDECLGLLPSGMGEVLKPLMFPAPSQSSSAAGSLAKPLNSILSIFIVEYALAQQLEAWGVRPAAMTGHSLGEYTAACLSGVISLPDALALVVARGRIFERLPGGAMLSVPLAETDTQAYLGPGLSIAAVNGPEACVISGESGAISALEHRLRASEIDCARLHISVAAHSPMLDPFLDEFAAICSRIQLHAPSIPYISNLTGSWVQRADLDDRYWVRHLRNTVRFSQGLSELMKDPSLVMLEVGPGTGLNSLAKQQSGRQQRHTSIACMRHAKEDVSDLQVLLTAMGRIWAAGGEIDWKAFWAGESRRRVAIPSYPFERKKHWIAPGHVIHPDADGVSAIPAPIEREAAPAKLPDMDSWFWRPTWEPSPAADPVPSARESWLVFCDPDGLAAELVKLLRRAGHIVTTVSVGDRFTATSEEDFTVGPGDSTQWFSLVASLADANRVPERVAYVWPYRRHPGAQSLSERIEDEINTNFWAPVSFIQTLAREDLLAGLDFTFITTGAKSVDAKDPLWRPECALLAGPLKVLPNEFPGVSSRWVDLDSCELDAQAACLMREMAVPAEPGTAVAYRHGVRLTERWVPAPPLSPSTIPPYKEGATYVFTGGLGGMAMTFARNLARKYRARVALLHRAALPARHEWEALLESRPASWEARQIRNLLDIEADGGSIHLYRCDVSDSQALMAVLGEIHTELGPVHGIFHAAGVMRDGIIQEKSREQALSVLAPKLLGTLAIDRAIEHFAPSFVVLFSSTSAISGLPGQIDYTSANAFLDAFAHSRNGSDTRFISLNWGIWGEVGMAAKSLQSSQSSAPPLDSFELEPARHWVLSEHKLKGGPFVLPGSAYVDFCLAAARRSNPDGPIELRNLHFLAPMIFQGLDELREITISPVGADGHLAIDISSAASDTCTPVLHVQAEYGGGSTLQPPGFDLDTVRARCQIREIDAAGGELWNAQRKHLDFGSRWSNVQRIWLGQDELIAELALGDQFAKDLAHHQAHPALLDMATSAGLALIGGGSSLNDVFVPLSYRRIVAYAALPSRIYSHIRLRHQDKGSHGVAVFDVLILAPDGRPVMQVEEFSMRSVTSVAFASAEATSSPSAPAARRSSLNENPQLKQRLEAGITTEEGISVLARVLADSNIVQVAATSIDLNLLLRSAKPQTTRRVASGPQGVGQSADKLEASLQKFWAELLGMDSVGLDEDFFDLGGHSLLAVRLFAKIRKAYNLDLGLTILFESRTIRQLAATLRHHLGEGEDAKARFSCLVPLRKAGAKPILFCLHGVGGNVLGYHELAKHLPQDQPFYAVQSKGLSREGPPANDMREIAAGYVREVLEVQPTGPFYLTGYSFGGVAAYEMALQLHSLGHRIAFLGLFDSDRPNATLSLGMRLRMNVDHILRLTAAERRKYLARKWQNIVSRVRPQGIPSGPVPAAAGDSPANAFQDVRKANFHAYHNYHAPPYEGQLTLFRATELGESGFRKPGLGWVDVVRGGIEEIPIPGNHMTILYEPCVSVLGRKLTECLDRVYRREGFADSHPPSPGEEDTQDSATTFASR